MRSISLKSKVVIGNVVLAILVLMLTSSIQMAYMKRDMARMLSDQQFAVVRRAAEDIDAKIDNDRDIVVRLAKGFPVSELTTPNAYFAARPALLATFDDLLILDASGQVIADYPHVSQRTAPSDDDRTAFLKVKQTLQLAVTEPAANASHGKPGLKIMAPILGADHRLVGVLVAILTLENRNLLGNLREAKVGKSGIFAVLSKTPPARYLVHPRKDMILKPRPAGAASAGMRALEGFEGSAVDTTTLGERSLFSYKSLRTMNWLLVAVVPLDEVYAPISQSERRAWRITGVVCLVIIPLSWVLAWLMLDPLSRLRSDIERLRQGRSPDAGGGRAADYARRDDEIGDVARSLYALIDERSAAAASQQAAERRSRELAESASRAKTDFLARMSHEVRTPMNGVLGLTELLLDTDLNSEQRDYVKTILSSGQALLEISNDILDLSKIDAGKLTIEAIAYDPVQTLNDVMALFGPRASARGLLLDKEVAPDVPHDLMGDPGRLRQVLSNLVGNSLKFTVFGSVHIALRVASRSDDEIVLEFAVTDTGIGMTADQQTQLFRDYSQADASTARRFGGTGLGLAICLKLVELMGGRFDVVSAPGRGSTFTFTMRCAPAAPGTTQPVSLRLVALDKRFSGRVLLVEDNVVNTKVARATLKGLGLDVLEAENGRVALDLLATETVDLVLMDMNMPVMDGIEATRRIRLAESSGEFEGKLPIIAMTANVLQDARDACMGAGMDGFISKPFQRAEIITILDRWLPGTALPAALPPSPRIEPPAREAIDLATYRELEQTMDGDMESLVATFVSSTTQLIEAIATAVVERDARGVKLRTHSMKSSAASIGALELARLAADWDRRLEDPPFADWQHILPTLQSEYARVAESLQRLARTEPKDDAAA